MMKANSIQFDEQRLQAICRRWNLAELWVFGSAARGEAGPDSDVDLLYVFGPDAHVGWEIIELEDELSQLFGRRAELVPKSNVHRFIRDRVFSEAQVLYAA